MIDGLHMHDQLPKSMDAHTMPLILFCLSLVWRWLDSGKSEVDIACRGRKPFAWACTLHWAPLQALSTARDCAINITHGTSVFASLTTDFFSIDYRHSSFNLRNMYDILLVSGVSFQVRAIAVLCFHAKIQRPSEASLIDDPLR